MRLLIATPLPPSKPGGPAQYAVCLKDSLVAKGHQVSLITFFDTAHYPTVVRHIALVVKAYSQARDVDIIIALDTFSVALPMVVVAKLLNKKIAIRAGGDFIWEHYIERTREKIQLSQFYNHARGLSLKERLILWIQKTIIIPHVDILVFSSEWLYNIWLHPYNLKKRRVAIIENASPPQTPVSAQDRVHIQTIVWIGRPLVLKNVGVLDMAIERVRKVYPALQYEKHSNLSHPDVIKKLRACRLLVIPSLSEVSPNLALEALATHTPVLLTSDCGIKSRLDGVVTWIDPMNVDSIVDAISALMTADGYARALTNTKTFQSTRTYDQIATEFLAMFP